MKRLLLCLALIACLVLPASGANFAPAYTWLNETQWSYLPVLTHNTTVNTQIPIAFPTTNASCQAFCPSVGAGSGNYNTFVWTMANDYTNIDATSEIVYDSTRASYPKETAINVGFKYIIYTCKCQYQPGTLWNMAQVSFRTNNNDIPTPPVADFIASATQVQTGVSVTLTDNSTGSPEILGWNWSVTPSTTAYVASPNAINSGVIFTAPGNYTVSHGVYNLVGSDIETKTDYINVYGENLTVTTAFAPIDGRSSAKVNHASVSIYDIENATWTNTSDINGGLAFITSLATHNLNAYASATGYQDNDLLNQPARDQSLGAYTILLWPDGYYNLTQGNVTLYVYATSKTGGGPIADVQVQASTSSDSQVQFTNNAGAASFTFPNQTNVYVWGHKAGWQDASVVVNTGNGNGGSASIPAYLEMYPIGVTPTQPNATPTPTITVCDENGCHPITIAPTQTVPPECIQDPNSAACRGAYASGGLNLLSASLYDIIGFCIVMFFIYMVLGIGKAM